jgi:alkylhydroperoxidase family enzyme
MARVEPLELKDLPEFEPAFGAMLSAGQMVPNSWRTMGRVPELLGAVMSLNSIVYRAGEVPVDLKRLVAHLASSSAVCEYCATHNFSRASIAGVTADKLKELWNFETSDLYSDAERAALRVAAAAGRIPNEVTDEMIGTLRAHYTETAIIELGAVIAMTGFTNRWNTTFATDLEPVMDEVRAQVASARPM